MADIIRVGRIPGKMVECVIKGDNTIDELFDMASIGKLENISGNYEIILYITHKTFDQIGKDRE